MSLQNTQGQIPKDYGLNKIPIAIKKQEIPRVINILEQF